ncbi:MAG: hypothetical protein IE885_03265 [Campylobacterales bacterium]|nr:hypothetical protein [Campylobacterales bacterium]
MKKTIATLILGSVVLFGANHDDNDERQKQNKSNTTSIHAKQIRQIDREHTKEHTRQRDFKTQKEFQRIKENRMGVEMKHETRLRGDHHEPSWKDKDHDHGQNDPYAYKNRKYIKAKQIHRHRGYKYPFRSWFRSYEYYRAPFYDQFGYYYGYFNLIGYYFEGIFYRYDRYYTYQDRIRGKGLFDDWYYSPEEFRP